MWKVSDVMEVSIPSGVGYGFNVITTEGRKPLMLFAYDEQEAAEAAAQQVAAVLERAVLVMPFFQSP
jgi:hypothetical protein